MAAVIECAKAAACKKIVIETRERFAEAIKLYEATGWQRGEDYAVGYGPERRYILHL